MRAGAECQAAVPAAVEDNRLGVREDSRVAIRRIGRQPHHVAGLHVAAMEVDVARDLACRPGEGEGPQHLLDGGRDDLRFVDDSLAVCRVHGEVPEGVTELLLDGIEAGEDEHLADRQQVLIADQFAVDPRLHQMRKDVESGSPGSLRCSAITPRK